MIQIITPKDIISLLGCSKATAYRRHQTCKDALRKQKHQRILLKEYADFEGIPVSEIEKSLKLI